MNNKMFWGMTASALALVAIAGGSFVGVKKVQNLQNENHNLRIENTLKTEENEKLKIDIVSYQKQLINKQAQVETLTQDKQNLENQVNDLNSQIESKDSKINSLTTTLQSTEQELLTQTEYLETCQNKASEIKSQIETLSQQDSQLNAQSISTLQEDLEAIETEVSNVENKINSLNATITNLNSNITTLTQEKQDLQSTVDSLNAQVESLNNQISTLNEQITGLNEQIQELESTNYYFRVVEGQTDLTLGSNILNTYVTGYNTVELTYDTTKFEELINGNDIVGIVINNTKYSIETNINFSEYSISMIKNMQRSIKQEHYSDYDYLTGKKIKYNFVDVYGSSINLSDFTDGDNIVLSNISYEFTEDSDFVTINATLTVLNTISEELLGDYYYNVNNVSYKITNDYVYVYKVEGGFDICKIIEFKNNVVSYLDKNNNIKSLKFVNDTSIYIVDENNSITYQKYLDSYSTEAEIPSEYLGSYSNNLNTLVVSNKNIKFGVGMQLIDYDEVSHIALLKDLCSGSGFVYVTFITEDNGTIKAASTSFNGSGGTFTKIS